MKFQSISAVFPAYNEEENLKILVPKVNSVLRSIFNNYEILVINDGSTDNTQASLEELSKIYPHLKIVRHNSNLGYGKAVTDGLVAASNQLVFFSDADNQFDINQISLLLEYIDNYDVVMGYRQKRHDNFIRSFYAWGWNKLNYMFFGLKIKDINCAFKIFTRQILDDINLNCIQSHGAMINAEILFKLVRIKAKMKEVPVSHFPRTAGKQTGGNPKVILKAIKEVVRIYLNSK